jgi:phage-related protein
MNLLYIIIISILLPFIFLVLSNNKKVESFGIIDDIVNKVGEFISDKILGPVKNLGDDIKNVSVSLGNKVLDGGGKFIESISDGVMAIKDKFLNIFTGLKDKLVNFVNRIKDGLSGFINNSLGSVKTFVEKRVNDVVGIKDFIYNQIKKLWARFEKKIMQSLQYIFYGLLALNGISLFGGLFNLIQYLFPRGCPNCSCQSC